MNENWIVHQRKKRAATILMNLSLSRHFLSLPHTHTLNLSALFLSLTIYLFVYKVAQKFHSHMILPFYIYVFFYSSFLYHSLALSHNHANVLHNFSCWSSQTNPMVATPTMGYKEGRNLRVIIQFLSSAQKASTKI